MTQFDNVSIIKKANIYFNGDVTSRTVIFANGDEKTLGIMKPGKYEFGTSKSEVMEILAGEVSILLPGEEEWKTIKGGEEFSVIANSKFKIEVIKIVDYCCSYY
ncbi:MAG: pyrimidine/purine nucleoside phosphorylase [Cellvibrionaceae bacterium]